MTAQPMSLPEKWVAAMHLMIAEGAEVDQVLSSMLASSVAGLKAIHPPRQVAETLNFLALGVIEEATRAAVTGEASVAADQLGRIVAGHVNNTRKPD